MKFLIAVLLLVLATNCATRPLSADEQVLILPTVARKVAGGIEADLQLWVYEWETRPGLDALLASHLDLDLDALDAAGRSLFHARTQWFRVDSESFKDIQLRFGGATHALPKTGFDGRSGLRVRVHAEPPADGWLPVEVRMPSWDPRHFGGRVLWVPEHGLSVVSDIDDTIKVSKVRIRRELLLNTFAREFAAVPGMAARYRALDAADTRFHYVSGSPLQLQEPLREFIDAAGFPAGSLHLRESTSIANVIPRADSTRSHKLASIGALLTDFPQRRFLLVGDSGEADPEIYAELARAHPDQIVAIRIRNASAEPAGAPRYAQTFAGLPATLWQVYEEAEQMRDPPLSPTRIAPEP